MYTFKETCDRFKCVLGHLPEPQIDQSLTDCLHVTVDHPWFATSLTENSFKRFFIVSLTVVPDSMSNHMAVSSIAYMSHGWAPILHRSRSMYVQMKSFFQSSDMVFAALAYCCTAPHKQLSSFHKSIQRASFKCSMCSILHFTKHFFCLLPDHLLINSQSLAPHCISLDCKSSLIIFAPRFPIVCDMLSLHLGISSYLPLIFSILGYTFCPPETAVINRILSLYIRFVPVCWVSKLPVSGKKVNLNLAEIQSAIICHHIWQLHHE